MVRKVHTQNFFIKMGSCLSYRHTGEDSQALNYTNHLTLRQTAQQLINSWGKLLQSQSQDLHLNTMSGVTLQSLAFLT